ncbi:MAG: hypothetical protein ACOCQA_01170 [bacterium]
MGYKGKLKYSAVLNFWYVLEENGDLHQLLDGDLIDADLYLSYHYHPCTIDIKKESVSFSNINLLLNRCYDYDIIFYSPKRVDDDNSFEFDIPF